MTLTNILKRDAEGVYVEWLNAQLSDLKNRRDLIREDELRDQSKRFLTLFSNAVDSGDVSDLKAPQWTPVKDLLSEISRAHGERGFTPSETATFVFSLKNPLFKRLRAALANDTASLFEEIWTTTELLDKLGLFTTEVHQRARETVINRQQADMLELSTPVVKLWDGVLALPMIGTLDSSRTQVVMESLLQKIVDESADVAIIDITGVPTVDTLVAQHLMKTVTAARLMGAECIISGIRPQIAQTIVHLGVELGGVVTKANLADAFAVALARRSLRVVPKQQ